MLPFPLRLATTLAVFASSALAQLHFAKLVDPLPVPFSAEGTTAAMALEDVDGDGDLDLVCGNRIETKTNRLYLNDGTGVFTNSAAFPAHTDHTFAVALGDVDGDGDPDLVFGNSIERNRLYLNDGTGTFSDATAARLPNDNYWTYSMALGDVDGDKDLDLVCGNGRLIGPPQNRLYVNDGTGTFTDMTAARMPVDTDSSYAVALADVDDDDDLDLVFGNDGQNRLYLNDGAGAFADATAVRMPASDVDASGIAVGDVDGDEDLDLVFSGEGDRLLLNDGTGTFTDATAVRMPADSDRTYDVTLGDVDGDGDSDLVFGCWAGVLDHMYLNDGAGTFSDVTAARMPNDSYWTLSVVLGDVDGDGDPDLIFGNGDSDGNAGEPNQPVTNLLRQLDVPSPVRPGHPYQLDVYARYGASHLTDVAVAMLSAGTASIPLPPFGTFGLDPALIVPLPTLTIPQPAGVASQVVPIPDNPLFVGLSIYAQAFLVQDPVGAYLTNVTANRIEP